MRRLPKPRATQANSTVPAITKPAQPISAMCANRPAVTQHERRRLERCSPRSAVVGARRASRR